MIETRDMYSDYFGVQMGEAEPLTEWSRTILNNNIRVNNYRRQRQDVNEGLIPEDKLGKRRLCYVIKEMKNSQLIKQDMYNVWEDEIEETLVGLEYSGENVPSDSVPIFIRRIT